MTISSHVLTVLLKDDKQNVLEVSFLQNEISLFIPRNVESLTKPSPAFMKGENGSISYHKFDIANVGEPKIIQITPNNNDVLFEIYWRHGQRPRVGGDHFVSVVPDFTSCTNLENGYQICEYDPYSVFIDASLVSIPGEYYMGIVSYRASKHFNSTQSRGRRSCTEGVRVRRSCIEYKDPPPRPTTGPQEEYKIQIPVYNPERDINYTVNSFSSPCMFWDEKNDTWTPKGCKVSKILSIVHFNTDQMPRNRELRHLAKLKLSFSDYEITFSYIRTQNSPFMAKERPMYRIILLRNDP